MANNPVNIGSIDFNDIKTSLTNYLKTQDNIKDFNFQGSIIQTIINLLSYNTYYYAFYSNMLANEMFLDTAQREESIISLLKPLGVTVPKKRASTALIDIGGPNSVPKFSRFRGTSVDGSIVYNFYNIREYNEASSQQDFIPGVKIYEGKQLVKESEITNSFDFDDQSYFIGNLDVDLDTVIVEVDEGDGDGVWVEWVKSDNIGNSVENLSQRIFFIERFDTGYELQFGKDNSLGNNIEETYRIRVSYIVTSGDAANGVSGFTTTDFIYSSIELTDNQASSGGLDSPDLDFYKFSAPKFFAAQNRAVTKSDFIAISTQFLRDRGYFLNSSNFTVFGGEVLNPPKFGRVFISTDGVSNNDISDLVAHLKDKCVVTVTPEFVESVSETIEYDVECILGSNNLNESQKENLKNKILTYLRANFQINNEFNINFTGMREAILTNFSDVIDVNIVMNYNNEYPIDDTEDIIINLNNKLDIDIGSSVQITKEYTDQDGDNVVLKYEPINQNDIDFDKPLKTYEVVNSTFVYKNNINGNINVKNGYIKILKETRNSPIEVDVNLASSTFVSGTNIKFSIIPRSVTLV
jgi:hypothetical protein